jgi:ATP-binding cassette, subfamily B, multidrug efflux pump
MDIFKRLKEFYTPYKAYFIWSMISLLFVTSITVVYPMLLQFTIDDVIGKEQYDLIPTLAIGFVILWGVKGLATYFHQYCGDLFGIRSVYALRNALYKKLQYLPFRYYDNAKTGDLMSRLTADVEGFRFFLSFGFAQLFHFILLVGLSLSVMFYYSVPLAFVTLVAMPFLAVAVFRFDKKVHPAFKGIRKSFAKLNTKVQENISGMNTVKALSREDFEINSFVDKNGDYKNQFIATSNIWAKYFPLMELIGNLCVVAILSLGGYLVMNDRLLPGELVAFFSLVWYILGPLMNLGFIINMFSQSKASGERLIEVLDADEDIQNQPNAKEVKTVNGEVEFRNVSLKYIDEEEEVDLKNITFKAKQGSVIGLIGATGSGKTSITQLMSRFYEPTSGDIFIDGKKLTEYTIESLRKNIGFVLQESFLFSSSIKDNISYGNPDATMEEIIAAAKRAQAHDFICELPEGYDTRLGERGMGLSGGQKQRIAIARSILINPSILVLDDATSAVDMETETRIQKELSEVMENRTTFVIAHRISSVKDADEILVLEDGEIVERGKHEQLIKNEGGYYRRIYDIQYKDRATVLAEQTV